MAVASDSTLIAVHGSKPFAVPSRFAWLPEPPLPPEDEQLADNNKTAVAAPQLRRFMASSGHLALMNYRRLNGPAAPGSR
jgi:hypothetical protein